MSEIKVSKMNYSKREYERKLNVNEYVFEIDGNDINNVVVTYSIDNIESTIYKDGYKNGQICEQVINIGLAGIDKFDNNAWISFCVKTSISYLNTLSKIPTDITHLLLENESFIKKPNEEFSGYLELNIPKNIEEDIYRKLTSLWALKIKENEFIFKLNIPNEIFTYFKIIFVK